MNRFKQVRIAKELTQSQMAELLGITKLGVAQYESGRRFPVRNILEKYAEVFNIPVAYFTDESLGLLPDFGDVSAGPGYWTNGNPQSYTVLPVKTPDNDFFIVHAKGDSMSPTIENGDILIIHRQSTLNHAGQIAVVSVGDEGRVKKVYYTEKGIRLVSVNPDYKPDFYANGEGVCVHGVVTGIYRDLN
ncbi:MAG: XRE family transcriptional regulator [Acidaminococcaceae bacterium]|nr:XRE family transcriptional regulator [Acidaminococcaceae bacterium]